MTDRRPALTLEIALYALFFLLALALRLLHLGAHPLNDLEAREALTVLARLRGAAPDASLAPSSPAYFFFTYFAFFLFSASEAAARVGPALAGSVLVLAPLLYRDRLGRPAAVAASGLLALSTGLLAASRSADGAVFAVLGLSAGLGALWQRLRGGGLAWLFAAAVAFGLGLAAGRTFVLGLLALVLTLLILRWTQPGRFSGWRARWEAVWAERRGFAVAFGLSALIISTVGLTYLRGLGALLDAFLRGFSGFLPSAGGRLPLEIVLFLVVFEPLLLVFGLLGAVRAFRTGHALGQALAWFSLVSLALVVLHGARALSDVIWVSAPLALLAAWALMDLLSAAWSRAELPLAGAQAGLSVALLGFALLNLAGLAEIAGRSPAGFTSYQVQFVGRMWEVPAVAQLGIAILAVVLVFVIGYLVALGWSPRAARLGLLSAWTVLLVSLTFGAGWGVTQARPGSPGELWWSRPAAPDVTRLMGTLGDVSNYTVGHQHDIQVTVQAPPDGLLAWALRDYPFATFVDRLDPVITSPVVIAPLDQEHPTLGSSYVGQDFSLRSTWTLDLSVTEWVTWLAYRKTPTLAPEPVILWVRQDVAALRSTGQ
jgi:hypothetical protein